MSRSENNLADLEFIFSELNRLSTWSFRDFKVHWDKHPEDKFHVIPLEDGSHISTNANIGNRFRELAIRNTESDQERNSYDLNSFINQLKKQFAHMFIELKRPLDKRASDRMIGKALSDLKKNRASVKHFIPCEIMYRQHPPQFRIGNVTFHSASEFTRQYGEELQSKFDQDKKRVEERWQDMESSGEKPKIFPTMTRNDALETEDRLKREFEGFFNELGWIAEVQVPPCLPDISFSRAKHAINSALDVLKLFYGEESCKKFRIAYDKGGIPRTSNLTRDEKNQFSIGW